MRTLQRLTALAPAFVGYCCKGARSARFIHWIPAYAGMAGWGRGNGEVEDAGMAGRRCV